MEPKINLQQHFDLTQARPAQPRARGEAVLRVVRGKSGRTQIKDLRQSGSSKLVFPRHTPGGCEAILVNTAGGVTGGDRFHLAASVGSNATLTITTQAAERAYRAQPGEIGQVETRLTVARDACLHWLPQELILFERCALHRQLEVTLEDDARFLMVEPMVFGRTAMGEKLHDIRFRDRITVNRNGKPLYLDGIDISGDATAHLARPATANGASAMASLVCVGSDAAAQLGAVRALLPATAGASMIADDVLVLRHLAADGFALRRDLIPVLEHLTDTPLPISWRL